MPVKKQKPITPGRRQMTIADFSVLTAKKSHKPLLSRKNRKAGRGSSGKISIRHHGGGAKKKYRIIDYKQQKINVPGRVVSREYDPNRSAYIMLVHYKDGDKRYLIAPDKVEIGSEILTASRGPIKPGNRIKLANIPTGIQIYNIELNIGRGGGKLSEVPGVARPLWPKKEIG